MCITFIATVPKLSASTFIPSTHTHTNNHSHHGSITHIQPQPQTQPKHQPNHLKTSRQLKRSRYVPTQTSMCDRSTEFQNSSSSPSTSVAWTPLNWHEWVTSSNKGEENKEIIIPALPFIPEEVFLPCETKRLHLFEAKNLELFEHSMKQYNGYIAHILIDRNRNAMAATCSLLQIQSWKKLSLGVLVTVQAVGRLHVNKLYASSPFLTGKCHIVMDCEMMENEDDKLELLQLECHFWKLFYKIIDYCHDLNIDVWRIKQVDQVVNYSLNSIGEQSHINDDERMVKDKDFIIEKFKNMAASCYNYNYASNSKGLKQIDWNNKDDFNIIVNRLHGISFGAWDLFDSSAQSRQRAIEQKCMISRMKVVIDALELRQRQLAAKCALKSVFVE